jgi:hypothetical protein
MSARRMLLGLREFIELLNNYYKYGLIWVLKYLKWCSAMVLIEKLILLVWAARCSPKETGSTGFTWSLVPPKIC